MTPEVNTPADDDSVTNAGNQGQPQAGNDEPRHGEGTSGRANRTKTAELILPSDWPEDSKLDRNVPETLSVFADRMNDVSTLLRVFENVLAAPSATIEATRDFVLVSGPAEMIDDLIAKGDLMEADWLDEDETPTGHKTVHVRWQDFEAEIDKNIAPLILELWKADLITCNSCEKTRDGLVWIEFIDTNCTERFLGIVARYEEETGSLYNRIRGKWVPDSGVLEGAWRYRSDVEDFAVKETEVNGEITEAYSGPSQFLFSMSVYFPPSDLPAVVDRLKSHNEGHEAGGNAASR